MDPDLAQQMFEEGGTLVMLGMPTGTEFGIDLNSWNIGERFKGVKMIPPGLHFIYFSAVSRQGDTAPRTGFFHVFQHREVLVRHYDPKDEDLKMEDVDPEEVERIRAGLRDLDRHLGAYPLESWEKWISLTQYIDSGELQRMLPESGRICSVIELASGNSWQRTGKQSKSDGTVAAETMSSASSSDQSAASGELSNLALQSSTSTSNKHNTDSSSEIIILCSDIPKEEEPIPVLPEMIPKAGTQFRFSKFPDRPYHDGATPSEVTQYSLDSSYSVRQMIAKANRPESMLSELQLAFISFLVGQVWDGWEQWQRLLSALCRAEELLMQYPELYTKFLSILHFQIHEVPEDLFVDIVESNNFLAAALTALFANMSDNSNSLPPALVKKAQRFKTHVTRKFKWDLNLEDEGEDAPVIVET
ncbi:protein AAR2 homolog [Homarus americanus]|uniref:Protein AAR2 homolog n=1 Tax=Homarus americanus TaxID=6706 RepID=A0A8J5J313_HOMAM|nr:protein AAR2 homolog [Homarus americanus]XP_042209157.1 protein AAR2 homolog [Homarus americanus]XP_042209158.1 protein AAR2 homolog [Homarus americanus]XP_042209159.1 protein AAR2 homolog [Homarus americanus]KAG7153612.1 AAR2-like [Homarus americanus]